MNVSLWKRTILFTFSTRLALQVPYNSVEISAHGRTFRPAQRYTKTRGWSHSDAHLVDECDLRNDTK
jgi:hypothetical protein